MNCEADFSPLFVGKEIGILKKMMISVSRICSTVEDLLFDVGKVFIHPEKVSTRKGGAIIFYQRHFNKFYLPINGKEVSLKVIG